jgi:hypothetical protein
LRRDKRIRLTGGNRRNDQAGGGASDPAQSPPHPQGHPLKAKLAFRAATQLPHGSLTVRLPDKRVVKVGGNNPGPDAVLILHNWNMPRRAMSESTIGVGEPTWTATGTART